MKLLEAIWCALFVVAVCAIFAWAFAGVYWVALHVNPDPREAIYAPYIVLGFIALVGVIYSGSRNSTSISKDEEEK